jgi:hypothetical protein
MLNFLTQQNPCLSGMRIEKVLPLSGDHGTSI